MDKKINLDNTKKERQKERKNERKYKDRKKERNKQIMLHQEVLYESNLLEVSKKERVSVFLTFGGKGGKNCSSTSHNFAIFRLQLQANLR